MEFNYDLPPPMAFSLEYSPALTQNWFWKSLPSTFKGFYGCSLSRIAEIADKYGYKIVQVHNIDVDLVRKDLAPKLGDIPHDALTWWMQGTYDLCSSGATHWHNPGGCKYWLGLHPDHALLAAWEWVTTMLPQNILRAVPFRLYLYYDKADDK